MGTRIRRLFLLGLALVCACGRLGYDRLGDGGAQLGEGGGPLGDGGVPLEPLDGAGPTSLVCDVEDPRLEACYAFDTDGRDGSAHRRDLVLVDTELVDGPRGMALSRADVSRVSAPTLTTLALTGLTIELWARVDEMPATGRAGLVDKEAQFGLFVHPGGEIRCSAGGVVTCGGLEPGVWRHVACTSDGTSVRLYLDGDLCGEVAAGAISTSDSPLHLGENSPDAVDALVGAIDSVRLWSAALSPEELCAAAGC